MRELKKIWEESEFARENLSFHETLSLILEKKGYTLDHLLLEKEIDEKSRKEITSLFKRAVNGEVLGYLLGKVPFYDSDFFVKEGVLVPRRDSETLVECAIENVPKNTHFIDMCTGSGCIGLSILLKRDDLTATLCDISPVSEEVAKENISRLSLKDRCSFCSFDLFSDRLESLGDFSALVMNPPYITTEEMKALPENVKKEPALALDGGPDGLKFYRFLAEKKDTLRGKTLIFEIGYDEGESLVSLFGGGKIIKDLSKNDRVFIIKL